MHSFFVLTLYILVLYRTTYELEGGSHVSASMERSEYKMGPLVLTGQQYFNRADVLVARKTLLVLDVNAADSDAVPLLRLPVKLLILHNPTRC